MLACRGSCFFLCATVYAASGRWLLATGWWRVTLRRSSHRATGGGQRESLAKTMGSGGELLAAPAQGCRRRVVQRPFGLSAEGVASNAPPKQWVKQSSSAVAATTERSPPAPARRLKTSCEPLPRPLNGGRSARRSRSRRIGYTLWSDRLPW